MTWTAGHSQTLRALTDKGLPQSEIAVAMGFSTGLISQKCRQLGIASTHWTDAQVELLLRWDRIKVPREQIAKRLGVPTKRVNNKLRELGFPLLRGRPRTREDLTPQPGDFDESVRDRYSMHSASERLLGLLRQFHPEEGA